MKARAFVADSATLVAGITYHRPSLVYLVSPNNPTGIQWTTEEVRALAVRFPDITFVVDEAYHEFGTIDPATGRPMSCAALAMAIAVRVDSPGRALFTQNRVGRHGKVFKVFKMRTMVENADDLKAQLAEQNEYDGILFKMRKDPRVTRVGAFLRRTSLDELPQLINVIQGRMSLVGPRPHAVAHNEEYRKLIRGYMIRHKVLPGMTGLAQVNGCRGEIGCLDDLKARVHLDLKYLSHWSPLLDLKILLQTAAIVFKDDKAY